MSKKLVDNLFTEYIKYCLRGKGNMMPNIGRMLGKEV